MKKIKFINFNNKDILFIQDVFFIYRHFGISDGNCKDK